MTGKNRTAGIVIGALASAVLGGCASSTPLQGDEIDRYDGVWQAQILPTERYQRSNQWHMTCEDMSGEFAFVVREGQARFQILGAEQQVPVMSDGRFELQQASGFSVEASPVSDSEIDDGQVLFVIKGRLAEGAQKGSLQKYVPSIDAGCRSKIAFRRLDN